MKVMQFKNEQGKPVMNHYLIVSGDILTFQSYDSTIATFDDNARELNIYPNWNYSNTTRKHFYSFLRQYVSIDANKKEVENMLQSGKHGNIVVIYNPNGD